MQNGSSSQCTGVFYDSGGPSGAPQSNENLIYTFCPDFAEGAIQFDFTFFQTQQNVDIMTIYDGDDTTAPVIGMYSGNIMDPFTVVASSLNPTGCLTVEYISNPTGNAPGWEAEVSCYVPCQIITPQIDSVTPSVFVNDIYRTCLGDELTLTGSGTFSEGYDENPVFNWAFGDGTTAVGETVTHTYAASGGYEVILSITDQYNCTSVMPATQVIQVATEPDFTGTSAADSEICIGETTDITGNVSPVDFTVECTPPVAGTTFLPDGDGVSYETCITVDCFNDGQTLDDISNFLQVCINMEHSYIGDLDIELTSPSGESIFIRQQAGGGTFLGCPIDDTTSGPGTGRQYCFDPNATVDLTGAPTDGGCPSGTSITPGTYMTDEPFTDLLGSTLNGDWCLTITDNITLDDGYIFEWFLDFDSSIVPPDQSFTPVITNEEWQADPTIVATNGNVITVEPDTVGQNCYTYIAEDDYGCTYTETVCIDVLPTPVANMPQDIVLCNEISPIVVDLTENDDDVLGTQTAADYTITYHESQADADMGMPLIADPTMFTPSSNPQTIFVRIEDATSGNCYDTASFTISSFTAEVGLLDDLTQCDNGTPDTSLFDLTENELNALNGQDPNDFTVTYHTTQANADAGTPSILTPNAYLNTANPELIYVRVENNLNVDCYDTGRFSLIVNVQPIANEPQDIELCSTGGGITFDLTENDDDVLGAQTASDVTITYHESQADADLGTPIIPNATSYTAGSNPQTIFVRIEDANSGECFDTNSFVISSFEVSIGELEDFAQCESDGPGTSTFDLTQNDDEALNGQDPNNYTVTYHSSQADADNDVAIAGDPTAYQNTSNPQTIFVRVEENSSVDCFVTDTFTLTVNDTPIANMPPNLEQCSTGGPSQLFDLTQVEGDVLGGQDATQFSITYHNSQADADANIPIVEDPTAYPNMSNPETIFVRIENNIDSSCYDTTSFQLIVNDRPSVAAAPQDLEECEDAMGNAFFNLETNTPIVLGAQDPNSYDVTYYESQLDADTPNAPIGNTTNYTALSNPQIIYIRIQNTASPECYETVSFQIESFSVAIGEPDDLFACDEGTGGFAEFNLTNNDNSVLAGQDPFLYTVTYHDTQAGADTNDTSIPDPTAYTNTTNPQTVFVRVENDENTTCYLTASFQLETTPSAPIQDPEPLEVCDMDNDGFSEFDLDSTSNGIALGNPDLVVTFHPTQSDAMNGVNDLSSPYGNVMEDTQTVYVRVEDDINGCVLFTELELIVYDSPLLETPDPLVLCDLGSDGEEVFDLTQAEMQILDGLDPALYDITYHETLMQAMDNMGAIGNPTAYTNQGNPQTIYVRVTDPSNMADCNNIVELELRVRDLPAANQPEELEVCDDETGVDTEDEVATFDLTTMDTVINGDANVDIFYYETTADIPGNPIADPESYVNIANPQTLEVRVEDEFGCENFTTLTLVVNPNPSIADMIFEYELCDIDNDGVEEFDLESQTMMILNNEPDVSITYHETMAEAEMGTDAIDTTQPYQNTEANVDDIYIRAENDITGCTTIRQLDLIVTASPEIESLDDLFQCDDDGDGEAIFDLTQNTPNALGTTQPDVTVSYHESETEAEDGTMPISMPQMYENQTNPQTIWIRLEGDDTQCVTVGSFEITVEALPVVNAPTALRICNDDYDDPAITTFDLTVKDEEITGQSPVLSNIEVYYYESQADLDNDNPIADPAMYENTQNNQTIFVEVVDTATMGQCSDTTTMTLTVLPLPSPSSTNENGELDQESCDDSDGIIDTMADFDLTASGDVIAMGENVDLTYHLSEQDALDNINAIPAAEETAYNTVTRTIWVRVENGNQNNTCSVLVSFEVVVNANPVLTDTSYTAALCEPEDTTPGITAFDAQEVTNNLVPDLLATPIADFTVTYHFTQAEADMGVNAIPDGFLFSEAVNNPVYIRVVDNTTMTQCYNSDNLAELTITVDTQPEFVMGDVDDIFLCADSAMDQDTSTMFDLTVRDGQIDGSMNPDTEVVYYASQADYDAGIEIDAADAVMYTNTANPQTIIAELFNPVTGCRSDGTVEFDLVVQSLPVLPAALQMPQGDIVCTDAQGNVLSPFDIGYDLGATDGLEYTYDWTPDNIDADGDGNEDAIYTVTSLTQATTYSVVITRVNDPVSGMPSCENGLDENGNPYTVTFTPSSAPFAANASVTETSFNEEAEYTVTVTPLGQDGQPLPLEDYLYRIDDGPLQTSNVFTGVGPGSHVGYAVDVEGCGEVGDPFGIIDYPRFFTPNGDGYNDTWNIIGIDGQPAAKIYIFDRYGKLLKQLSPTGNGWDGTFNGRVLPSDDYWFSVEFVEPADGSIQEFRANFTLKR